MDAPRQSMPVATRLEDGTVLLTEQDHERAAAPTAAAAHEIPEQSDDDTPATPAESGAGEEIESDAS